MKHGEGVDQRKGIEKREMKNSSQDLLWETGSIG